MSATKDDGNLSVNDNIFDTSKFTYKSPGKLNCFKIICKLSFT